MSTYKIKCPKCKQKFTRERIVLFEKNKKEITKREEVDKLAPKVKELINQISPELIKKIKPELINIEKITIITADREQQLQQTNNPGYSLEVTIVPGLEPPIK